MPEGPEVDAPVRFARFSSRGARAASRVPCCMSHAGTGRYRPAGSAGRRRCVAFFPCARRRYGELPRRRYRPRGPHAPSYTVLLLPLQAKLWSCRRDALAERYSRAGQAGLQAGRWQPTTRNSLSRRRRKSGLFMLALRYLPATPWPALSHGPRQNLSHLRIWGGNTEKSGKIFFLFRFPSLL